MAAISSSSSGLSNATTTWVGGVVPVEGDNVTIAAGHVVEINASHTWGNDTATAALTVAGTCKFSRSVSTVLRLKGDLVNSGTAAVWDRGTIADPIPLGVTHNIRINYSATPANSKYQGKLGLTTRFSSYSEVGLDKTRVTSLVGSLTSGAVSATVSDASNWEIGDIIFIESDTSTNSRREHRVLTSVSGATVGWSGGLSFPKLNGAMVGNLSSNVSWESDNASFPSNHVIGINTLMLAATINIKNVGSYGMANSSDLSGFGLTGNALYSSVLSPWGVFDKCISTNLRKDGTLQTNSTNLFGMRLLTTPPNISNLLIYNSVSTGTSIFVASGATCIFNNLVVNGGAFVFTSAFSQGGVGVELNNAIIKDCTSIISASPCIGWTFNNCLIDGFNNIGSFAAGSIDFNNCSFGQIKGSTTSSGLITISSASGGELNFTDCLFPELPIPGVNLLNTLKNTRFNVINRNADITRQEIWKKTGGIVRDNSVFNRGTSSIKFTPIIANTQHGNSYPVTVSSGSNVIINGFIRFDSTYGTVTPPTITLSGMGATTATFTAPSVANTWHEFTLTALPTITGNMKLEITGQSTSTTGTYWLDGVSLLPFVTFTRHYGYIFDPSSVLLEVDPIIQANEATASAYTGISINFGTGTVTVSADHSIREIYDYCHSQLVLPANLDKTEFITSTDGINFFMSYDLILNANLTGTGKLDLGANDLTITGTSTLPITHSGGVYTAITVSGFVANSRIQVYNQTTSTELYNAIVSGTSLRIEKNWNLSDELIRIRVAYQNGVTAKLPIEVIGQFNSSGLNTFISQVNDAVYILNSIDGSMVTEFTADFTNILIEVTDIDGVTTPQRMYAWYVWSLMTSLGIANYFNAATAEDQFTYRINSSIVNLKLKNNLTSPLLLSGARLYRDDDVSIFATGNGPVQSDAGKAYLAQSVKIDEIHGRLGLDAAAPLVTSTTQISFGSVLMDMVETSSDVTVTRQ
jgi:hypothetical protein